MAANVDIEKQFLRLIMFCHKISIPVVRTFFVSGVLGCPDYNNDISTFLEHHKHEIFHLVGDYKCCQCTNLPSLQLSSLKFSLGNDQFKKLYEIGLSQPGHFMKGSRGRVFQQCLCCVTVRKETDPKTYDISLLFAILYNCVELSDNRRLWLETIRKGRNRLCHLYDINDLSENELQTLWGNLECSVVRLAEEIHSLPYYKECIEQHVDTFKYTDYNREAIIPIIESMRSEINNNINEVIQNQMISQEEVRCLTIHVEQLSQNCKRDNKNMFNHVSESAKTIVDLHQDAVHQMSAQVAKCHIEEVELIKDQNKAVIESSKKVSGTMEHVIEKLNFLVDIAIDNTKYQHTENNSTLPKGGQSNERSTTQEQKYSEEQEIKRCKLHWRIETPEYLEHKKDDIVKAMKNAIEIVKIGTSHEIEDINEGSITIDTLLPISILQDEKAFHHSIRKFLDAMVSICRIDTSIPLEVKVQITFIDQEQGSVRYSIDEINHTTTINRAVQAVPTMMDKSTTAMESPINETTDNPNCIEKAVGGVCIRDIKPAAVQSETNDLCEIINQRSLGSEHQDTDCHNDIGWICLSDPFLNPLTNKPETGVSAKGYPVVVDEPYHEVIETQYLHLARDSPTNTIRFCELDLSPGLSRNSGSFSSDCDSCILQMQKLNCEETKQFWKEIGNKGLYADENCHDKFFDTFLERLKDVFPREEGLKSRSTINLLAFLLNIDRKNPIAGIKLCDLKRITDLFGPIKKQDNRCVLICQLHLLIKRSLKTRDKYKKIKSSWFVGDMTRKEAEKCLLAEDCKDKTYLVRISGADGEDGDFELSVRHEDHCHHLKIQGNPKTALSESPYNAHLKFAGREFSSLPEVIDYVTQKQEIVLDTEDENGDCSSVMCLRVFTKSPLNGAMTGYEKAK